MKNKYNSSHIPDVLFLFHQIMETFDITVTLSVPCAWVSKIYGNKSSSDKFNLIVTFLIYFRFKQELIILQSNGLINTPRYKHTSMV
jgi:hypothetical protein